MATIRNILIAIDQLGNTLLGGEPDETISARAWRLREVSRVWATARRVIDAAFFWQPGHCEASYLSELGRRHLPTSYADDPFSRP